MKMLEDLEEVVRALHECTKGEWQHRKGSAVVLLGNEGGFDISDCPLPRSNAAAIAAAINFLRTYHAAIADMDKRLDASERDAARLDWLESQREAYGFESCHESNRWVLDGPFSTARKAIDAAMQEAGR